MVTGGCVSSGGCVIALSGGCVIALSGGCVSSGGCVNGLSGGCVCGCVSGWWLCERADVAEWWL